MKTEKVARPILENKLLDALQQDGVVAVLMNQEELEQVIRSLNLTVEKYDSPKARELSQDYARLHQAAFRSETFDWFEG